MRLVDAELQHVGEPEQNDGVDPDHIRKNRPALLQVIQAAKKYFTDLAR